MNPLVLIGLGLLGYYLYTQNATPVTAAGAVPTNAAATPPVTDTSTNPTTPPGTPVAATPPSYTGADPTTYVAVVAAALQGLGPGAGQTLQSPDVWNFYAKQAIPSFTAPDPATLLPGNSNPHAPIDFTTWWNATLPYLPAGLSGLGDFVEAAYAIPQNPIASQMARRWYV